MRIYDYIVSLIKIPEYFLNMSFSVHFYCLIIHNLTFLNSFMVPNHNSQFSFKHNSFNFKDTDTQFFSFILVQLKENFSN